MFGVQWFKPIQLTNRVHFRCHLDTEHKVQISNGPTIQFRLVVGPLRFASLFIHLKAPIVENKEYLVFQ